MTTQRLLTTGFPWHVFPVRCRDVARGITPLFQATPFRVRHWTEPPDRTSLNPGACWLYNDAENGLLIVTDIAVPPKLPDGWMVQQVSLDEPRIRHVRDLDMNRRCELTWAAELVLVTRLGHGRSPETAAPKRSEFGMFIEPQSGFVRDPAGQSAAQRYSKSSAGITSPSFNRLLSSFPPPGNVGSMLK